MVTTINSKEQTFCRPEPPRGTRVVGTERLNVFSGLGSVNENQEDYKESNTQARGSVEESIKNILKK